MKIRAATKTRFLIALASLVAVLCTSAAIAAGAGQNQTFSQGAVVKAFAKSGLPLVNPQAGYVSTATTLNLENPSYPFTLGVTIYPTVGQAERAFKGGEGPWRSAGYAVAIARNVIVAVVPRGASLGRRAAKPFAMPAKVSASIARLS